MPLDPRADERFHRIPAPRDRILFDRLNSELYLLGKRYQALVQAIGNAPVVPLPEGRTAVVLTDEIAEHLGQSPSPLS